MPRQVLSLAIVALLVSGIFLSSLFIQPRALNAKSHEPEPVVVTVTELGIKGWLKGER